MSKMESVKDPRLARLANEISDVINAALHRGLSVDLACSVAVGVAADYGRGEYGDAFLDGLAKLIAAKCGQSMPADISSH